jgi:hypothetical protein
VLSPGRTGNGTSERILECTKMGPNGECLQKSCKQGDAPGSPAFDCASYAAACVNAGEHWAGTSEGGKCTKVL